MNVEDRLAAVLESVFGPEARAFADSDGPGTVLAWDSVTHLQLVLAIEADFGIRFETADIPNLQSIGNIREALSKSRASHPPGA